MMMALVYIMFDYDEQVDEKSHKKEKCRSNSYPACRSRNAMSNALFSNSGKETCKCFSTERTREANEVIVFTECSSITKELFLLIEI